MASNKRKKSRSAQRAEKRSGSTGGSDMKRFYMVLALVAVVGVGVVGYSLFSGATSSAVTAPVEVEGLDDPTTLLEMAKGVEYGNPDATVAIWEFADYQCPACQVFAGQVKPQLDLAYVETGKVKYVYYDYPLQQHQNAFLAARAARCAGEQDRYWDFHDRLFQTQGEWQFSNSAGRDFRGSAGDLGLDESAFAACLDSDRHADVVTANMRLGNELRVNATPTIMVVPEGSMPIRLTDFAWPTIQEAVEGALAAQ